MGILAAAVAWDQAGCSVVPVTTDGGKLPAVAWKAYQRERPDRAQIEAWFGADTYEGLGVICGAVSGNLEMLEVEGRAVDATLPIFVAALRDHGLGPLWDRLNHGYLEQSPSGGLHWLYRVAGTPRRNLKLARRPTPNGAEVLIETRGEGGYVVVAPSAGRTHTTGRAWVGLIGNPGTIPVISEDERDALHAVASTLDEMPVLAPPPTPKAPGKVDGRPGDDFNERAAWEEILADWTKVAVMGRGYSWRRPGKARGISATTGQSSDGADRLYVFSTSTVLEIERPYSKFAAYTLLQHGGDYSAAARELRRQGYGQPASQGAKAKLSLVAQPPVATTEASDQTPPSPADPASGRILRVTRASDVIPRPVRWLWSNRIALGTLALLGGREGIGKSTVGYTLAADITCGRLRGEYEETPKGVIVAATEDSWEHTIVPRLMAAGADLELVYRVDVISEFGVETALTLPRDLVAVERLVTELNVALILLDPLMSRLDAALDTHKDAEVRLALEPVTALADRTGAAVLGLIHVNKGSSTDPLTMLMGSRAFTAVSRAVLFVMTDPDDESIRLFGEPKNNLGRTDLPTLTFRIVSKLVAQTDEGPISTGCIEWIGESTRSIREALAAAGELPEVRTATADAMGWLVDYLISVGRVSESAKIQEEGRRAGHAKETLRRARERLKIQVESQGFPRQTFWRLPDPETISLQMPDDVGNEQSTQMIKGHSGPNLGESELTGSTWSTGQIGHVESPYLDSNEQSTKSTQGVGSPRARARARETCPICGWETGSHGCPHGGVA